MTSFLIVSQENKQRQTTTKALLEQFEVTPFDSTFLTKETTTKTLRGIGIEDIKQLQKKIFLKPIKSKNKAIIIEDAELLTTEAQNALLKVLEEPPDSTIIILVSEIKEALLPTILSRCQIIEIARERSTVPSKEQEELQFFWTEFSSWGIGERLKKAELLAKDKDKAVEWIGKLILTLRESLLQQQSEEVFTAIRSFQSLHTLLKTTNVNPRFAIENTLLQLE